MRAVRFGLFYEHQLPRPHVPGAEEKLLNDALRLVARLGEALAQSPV